jgi:hypothetical protein
MKSMLPPHSDRLGAVGSLQLGMTVAGANLAVCGALATILLLTTAGPNEPAAQLGPGVVDATVDLVPPTDPSTREVSPDTATTTVIETDAAEGYQPVSGPGGITTVIPAGWSASPASGPGAMQANDPADPTRFIRFGGSAAPREDIYGSHVAYQSQISDRPGFRSIRLEPTRFHGAEAVAWEFQWDVAEGRRHVSSLYWRIGGTEYFVLAAALVHRWPETEPIFDAMIANAQP